LDSLSISPTLIGIDIDQNVYLMVSCADIDN